MLDGVVVHARQSGLANPGHCDQILLLDAFFGKHGFQLDANHINTSLFFTISHPPRKSNEIRNIDVERRLRGARE